MKLILNGEEREFEGPLTVADLLGRLGISGEGIAVAVNLEVVPRGELDRRQLVEGERVEIVRAVGGG
ncbi:MAG: sulfur carrier protein ThiS [Nitrospinota bacterium]